MEPDVPSVVQAVVTQVVFRFIVVEVVAFLAPQVGGCSATWPVGLAFNAEEGGSVGVLCFAEECWVLRVGRFRCRR